VNVINVNCDGSVAGFAPECVLMATVAATAIQIHHDIAGVADDVDDDGCRRTLGQQFIIRNSCSVSRTRCQSAAATGFQTESHFHQNECSRARASDGQNIYCRRVINNVGTGWAPGFGCVSSRYRSRSDRKIYTGIVRCRAGGASPAEDWPDFILTASVLAE